VEGGGEVLGSFFEAGLVDEAAFFIAPVVLGGARAKRAVSGAGFRRWRLGPEIADLGLARVGPDLLARGRVVR
jgi:diaminohydroxyphosphoribosylaminopyrimidine deaminase/5-amino-6-(5-phosphoribosylamino)uracil reductase